MSSHDASVLGGATKASNFQPAIAAPERHLNTLASHTRVDQVDQASLRQDATKISILQPIQAALGRNLVTLSTMSVRAKHHTFMAIPRLAFSANFGSSEREFALLTDQPYSILVFLASTFQKLIRFSMPSQLLTALAYRSKCSSRQSITSCSKVQPYLVGLQIPQSLSKSQL